VLVVEKIFAEFSSEITCDHLRKRHEPSAWVECQDEERWKVPAPSAVQTQDLKMKVSPRLKATVGLMKIEAVEFAMRSSVRSPT
jgi:hypothetical protein